MTQQQQRPAQPLPTRTHPALLADDALDVVVGGLDCSTALAVSRAYAAAGGVMTGLGDNQMASYFYGRATGVLEGGCPK